MKYHRFQLLFTTDRAGGYFVQALTPQGQGHSDFVPPPFASGLLPHITLPDGAPNPRAAALGDQLFEALFQKEILSLYERSLDAAVHTGSGLRIELTLNPLDPDLAAIQSLPWELLRQPGTPKFLALNPGTPVTRFLEVPRSVSAATRPQTLRILVVRPLSSKATSLDLDKEFHNLQEAVCPAAEVIPVAPTLSALRQALRDHEAHILHFMGHGRLDEKENVLIFEDDKGNPDPVTGTYLATILAASPALRLVVLNTCESASVRKPAADGRDFNPLTGVANALVLADLPAVIAMQGPVSDAAAIAFSRTFYQQLAAGEPVDAAVTEARRAVLSEDRDYLEWAIPVLFMRTSTGELYPEVDLWDRPPEKKWSRWLTAALLVLLLGGAGLAVRNWWTERLVTEAMVLFGQGKNIEALGGFQAAHRLRPTSAEILSNLAGAEESLGYLRDAEDHYREAVQRQPDSAEHLYNLGHFLNSRTSHDEAYRFLLHAIERDPQRADAHAELAQAAAALGMLNRARIHLKAALRLDPQQPALYRRLGELELDAGNPRAAIPRLNEALRRYPLGDRGQVETVWLLARAQDRLGNSSSACRDIQEIRRLDPPGITPWAQKAEEMAARRGCSPP